ncbi:MAG: type II toxin-antitoxin system VapC family toxin [Acidobacteriota bacterium]
MPGRYLLDTNIAILILNQKIHLASKLSRGVEIYLDAAAVGELYYGAAKSGRPKSNRQRIEGVLEYCPVLAHDLETSVRYGLLKAQLGMKGRMIPENDVWIAASALRYSLTLATRDRHFGEVEGLAVEAW